MKRLQAKSPVPTKVHNMHSSSILCSLFLVSVLHALQACKTDLQADNSCTLKPPAKDYNGKLLDGKFYMIAEKASVSSYPHQKNEIKCTSGSTGDADRKEFPYSIFTEDQNGKAISYYLKITNLSPPGTLNVTFVDSNEAFEATVIGINKQYHIFYSCKGSDELIQLYYYKRVNGIDKIDSDTMTQVNAVLKANSISTSDLKPIDNSKCNPLF